MARTRAVRQPDLILISWSRNPLMPGSPRRITASRVIGSAQPCRFAIQPNGLVKNALACLLDHDIGFKVVFQRRTSTISGYMLLQRIR
ncbi:hypothetical protein PAESOLCIP111_06358 [Paenibacillus solanacearum]|uniref:Uncharacterized protein n=1 Tax=Paenibacillus solanacearum TaxID=2048548 RepID=A0A916K7T0_9BACL|nr:hypothetical protein [Paenibacillus solanacearum]CAG7651640.1 hypothetical protein PAESOLCIP111_06358 [Paenibacillus solanacearum]